VAEGETLVRGALELRVKESDRLAAMAQGLTVLGVENQLLDDGLWIRGGAALGGGTIESHGDHRIAMAFAVAALAARSAIEIRDVANVATSFPGFLELARSAGLQIETL
jgi:3-phosphoshikimate 1-carboxyvinyltransferase